MRDEDKTREQLVEELAEERCRVAELEALGGGVAGESYGFAGRRS